MDRKKAKGERSRIRRQERLNQGLCGVCGKRPFQSGRTTCNLCHKRIKTRDSTKWQAYHKTWMDKNRELVFAHYGDKCACCGEDNPFFLTIDHINNDGHKKRKTSRLQWHRAIKDGFPSDLQILCFNCNLGKSRNNGVCPHVRTRANSQV